VTFDVFRTTRRSQSGSTVTPPPAERDRARPAAPDPFDPPQEPAVPRLTTSPARTSHRALPALAAALGVLVLAASAAAPEADAARAAPCPTAGTTLLAKNQNLRVYRTGSTLKVCGRYLGQKRRLRTLGPWSPETRIATDYATVAWTTSARDAAGVRYDAVTSIDVLSGRRWLQATKASPARDATTPATRAGVAGLTTTSDSTAWVTTAGVVALAVRSPLTDADLDDNEQSAPALYRTRRRVFVLDVGPARAAPVAADLELRDSTESDDCGGTTFRFLDFGEDGTPARASLLYREDPVPPAPGC
jgi:hypothetical protein